MRYPKWKLVAWRGFRTAFVTAVVAALGLDLDWSSPEMAFKILVIAVISGFFVALGKWIREEFAPRSKAALLHKLPF